MFVRFIRGRPSGRQDNLIYLWLTMRVDGFNPVPWVRSIAPCESSGSFGFVGFIHERPGCRQVDSGSLDSFERALGGVKFIQARLGGRCVHSGSLGSFRRGLPVVGLILVRWVHSCRPLGSSR